MRPYSGGRLLRPDPSCGPVQICGAEVWPLAPLSGRTAPQIRPAPAPGTPFNAICGLILPQVIPGPAGDFHFWPNLSPAPRPSALAFSWVLLPDPLGIVRRAWRSSHPGGNFYAWHFGAPPAPPFPPSPRCGIGQGGGDLSALPPCPPSFLAALRHRSDGRCRSR